MKIHIEIEIGDKIIADTKIVPDLTLEHARIPHTMFWDLFRCMRIAMQPAVADAINERYPYGNG